MTANLKTWTTTEVGNFVRGTQEATKLSLKKKQDTLIALCSLEQLNLFKKKKRLSHKENSRLGWLHQ